jgi:hypothetical protein
MNASLDIIKTTKDFIKTTGPQLMAMVDKAFDDISKIETIKDAAFSTMRAAELERLLKLKSVQTALGEKLEEFRQKVAQLKIQSDLIVSKIAQQSTSDEQKRRRYAEAGISEFRAKTIEQAATIPESKRRIYEAAKFNEGTLPNTPELATIARLPKPAQERVFAKLGDIATAKKIHPHMKSVTVLTKHEEQKALKTWIATPNTTIAPKVSENHLAAAQLGNVVRSMQSKLIGIHQIIPRFQGEKSVTNINAAKKELLKVLYDCESKWKELYEIGFKLAQ